MKICNKNVAGNINQCQYFRKPPVHLNLKVVKYVRCDTKVTDGGRGGGFKLNAIMMLCISFRVWLS